MNRLKYSFASVRLNPHGNYINLRKPHRSKPIKSLVRKIGDFQLN